MSQTLEHKIVRIDAALESLHRELSRCTDPADVLRVSESIDVRLDERLRLMRDRDDRSGENGGGRRSH
jgi:hypothetical protein